MRASVIIPAHDEGERIGATLAGLLDGAAADELEVIVVCNGCNDGTAVVAREFAHGVRVVELPEAGKAGALNIGDALARRFPRVYLDADVRIGVETVRELVAALGRDGVDAAAPAVELDTARSSWAVRMYLAVWQRLPQVRTGVAGRGAYALTEEARRRFGAFPTDLLNDDGFIDRFFAGGTFVLPEHRTTVEAPATFRQLVGRRTRVHLGNVDLGRASSGRSGQPHDVAVLLGLCRRQPTLMPSAVVFVGVTALVRVRGWLLRRSGARIAWSAAR